MIVYRLTTDDAMERLELNDGAVVKALQEAVGGPFEIVRLSDYTGFIVNEEGQLQALAVNALASVIASRPLFGPVVAVGFESTPKGEDFTSTPAWFVENLRAMTGGGNGDAE